MPIRPPPLGPKKLRVAGPARADMDDALAYLARERSVDIALAFADQ